MHYGAMSGSFRAKLPVKMGMMPCELHCKQRMLPAQKRSRQRLWLRSAGGGDGQITMNTSVYIPVLLIPRDCLCTSTGDVWLPARDSGTACWPCTHSAVRKNTCPGLVALLASSNVGPVQIHDDRSSAGWYIRYMRQVCSAMPFQVEVKIVKIVTKTLFMLYCRPMQQQLSNVPEANSFKSGNGDQLLHEEQSS